MRNPNSSINIRGIARNPATHSWIEHKVRRQRTNPLRYAQQNPSIWTEAVGVPDCAHWLDVFLLEFGTQVSPFLASNSTSIKAKASTSAEVWNDVNVLPMSFHATRACHPI